MRMTSEELKAKISQETYNNKVEYYKSIRHSLMADVVNPHNLFELYGKGTRIARWTTYKHGFPLGKILAFPPLKEGEPISEKEKQAWERIDEDKKTYFKWRSQQRPVGYYKSGIGKAEKLKSLGVEAQRAAQEEEEARKAAREEEKKAAGEAHRKARTKMKMIINEVRNLPNGSSFRSFFHLFKRFLNKKNKKRRIGRMRGNGKNKNKN